MSSSKTIYLVMMNLQIVKGFTALPMAYNKAIEVCEGPTKKVLKTVDEAATAIKDWNTREVEIADLTIESRDVHIKSRIRKVILETEEAAINQLTNQNN